VYDNQPSGQNSRVSCADVMVLSRDDDQRFTLRVKLNAGDVPVQSQTALNRLLNDPWATTTSRNIDIFTLPDDTENTAKKSQQIRLADPAIVKEDSGEAYVINFVLSGTSTLSASALTESLQSQDLSAMFDLEVMEASTTPLNAAAANGASIIGTIAIMVAAWAMQCVA
jgi:hypothetical protein